MLNNCHIMVALLPFQISVIPARPESFLKDSRRASLAGMTPNNQIQIMYIQRSLQQGSPQDYK